MIFCNLGCSLGAAATGSKQSQIVPSSEYPVLSSHLECRPRKPPAIPHCLCCRAYSRWRAGGVAVLQDTAAFLHVRVSRSRNSPIPFQRLNVVLASHMHKSVQDSEFEIPRIVEPSPCTCWLDVPQSFCSSLPISCTLGALFLCLLQAKSSREFANLVTGYVAPLSHKLNAMAPDEFLSKPQNPEP